MINNIGNENSLLNQFISELRDEKIQKDQMRFRRNMERIGEIFAYEISKTLKYKSKIIKTPLGNSQIKLPASQPIIATILRAGLPLHRGLLNYFDHSSNAFISAYRKHYKGGSFDVAVEYVSCPKIAGKVLILADPMLATGQSMILTYQALKEFGIPFHTHIVSVIASTEGIDYISTRLDNNCTIWTGAVDEELTAEAYIVPGLGDAGDLSYGTKE